MGDGHAFQQFLGVCVCVYWRGEKERTSLFQFEGKNNILYHAGVSDLSFSLFKKNIGS